MKTLTLIIVSLLSLQLSAKSKKYSLSSGYVTMSQNQEIKKSNSGIYIASSLNLKNKKEINLRLGSEVWFAKDNSKTQHDDFKIKENYFYGSLPIEASYKGDSSVFEFVGKIAPGFLITRSNYKVLEIKEIITDYKPALTTSLGCRIFPNEDFNLEILLRRVDHPFKKVNKYGATVGLGCML
jgi:hypothetical protein